MDEFGTIRLHHRTIKRFKRFSRKIKSSYSETLESVMDFFEWHGISPSSRFASQISKEEERTRKRVESAIAIIKDIEKTQTMPTTMMLQALFGKHEVVKKKRKPLMVEKEPEKKNIIPIYKYDALKRYYLEDKETINELLSKIEKVEPRFGKSYFKIDIYPSELTMLKRKLTRNRLAQ